MYRMARSPLVGELLMTITAPEKLIGGVEYIGYVDKSRFDPVLRGFYMGIMSHRRNRFRLMQIIRQLPADARDLTSVAHLPRLREIRQPVLLTWGQRDPLLVPESGPRLAEALPNLIFEPQADLAHMPHEEAPERIGPRWAAFLNGRGG
jgi:pimeloyl-ACP methyl ester carboxylesterase